MSRLPFAAAADSNKEAIFEVLSQRLAVDATVLEVGSGTGQHAVHFAAALPQMRWQPTELADNLDGIRGWVARSGVDNVLPPLALDVFQQPWPQLAVDACYSANTLHILHWPAVEALFGGAAAVLPHDGRLFVYGPFLDGDGSAASNVQFDLALRRQDPSMGVRELAGLRALAESLGLYLIEQVVMPRDNALLVFRREG